MIPPRRSNSGSHIQPAIDSSSSPDRWTVQSTRDTPTFVAATVHASKRAKREAADMYISPKASIARQREAQNARNNRAEIIKALSHGQINRRDLFKWGIFTATGALALKNGLSPFARSAFAAVPTGTPRSPLFGAAKFSTPLPRLALQTPLPAHQGSPPPITTLFPAAFGERPAKRLSYHTDFSANPNDPQFRNLTVRTWSDRGPPARRNLCPSALGRVLPQGRLRDDARTDRAEQPLPSQLPGAKPEQRLVLRHRPSPAGTPAAAAVQGPLWRADPDAHLQQPAR